MPSKSQGIELDRSVDWTEFATVKNWKQKLTVRSKRGGLPEATWKACKQWMPYLINSSQKTPDELIEESLIDSDIGEERLSAAFMYAKKKGKTHNSALIGIYGTIRGFYSHNKINTQRWHSPAKEPRRVELTDADNPLFVKNMKTKKLELNRPLLQQFYKCLNFRDEIIADCLVSSGMDTSDLLKLTVGYIRNQDPTHERIFISNYRNKNGEIIRTFLSKRATKNIRKYVKNERANATDDEEIFITSLQFRKFLFKQKYNRPYTNLEYDLLPPPEPVIPDMVADNFRNAAKTGLKIRLTKGQQSPFRPKRLRHVFRQACQHAGLDDDIARVFMGQSGASSKKYQPKSREELESYYELIEPFISVYLDDESIDSIRYETDSTVNVLKNQIENLQDQLKRKDDIASNAITELQKKLESLESKLNSDR